MNLCSCENCGVVLDKDKLSFPQQALFEDGIDPAFGAYNQEARRFETFVACPVCKTQIFSGISA